MMKMHRDDLRYFSLEDLLELSIILPGCPIPPEARFDKEKIKDVIVKWVNDLPPFAQMHQMEIDQFLGRYRGKGKPQ